MTNSLSRMKQILSTLLLYGCAHTGIQPYTSLHLDSTPFNPYIGLEPCSAFTLQEIVGELDSTIKDRNRLQLDLLFPIVQMQSCSSGRCLNWNTSPTNNTSFYIPTDDESLPFLDYLAQELQPREEIRIIGCPLQQESFLIVALQADGYSIVFHNPRKEIKQR